MALGFDLSDLEGMETVRQRVAVACLFAIGTAVRAGEICVLKRTDIAGRVATLQLTKDGTKRKVPFSSRTLKLLTLLPEPDDEGIIFGMSTASVDALFHTAQKASDD